MQFFHMKIRIKYLFIIQKKKRWLEKNHIKKYSEINKEFIFNIAAFIKMNVCV